MGGVNREQNWPFECTRLLGLLVCSTELPSSSASQLCIQQIFIADINGSLSGCTAPVLSKLYYQSFHNKQNKVPEQKTFEIRQTLKTCYFIFDGNIIKPNPTNVSMKAARCQCNIKKKLQALQTLLNVTAEELTCLGACGCDKRHMNQPTALQQMSSRALCDTACYQTSWERRKKKSPPPLLRPEACVVPDPQLDTSDCAIAINGHILQQICATANCTMLSSPVTYFGSNSCEEGKKHHVLLCQ